MGEGWKVVKEGWVEVRKRGREGGEVRKGQRKEGKGRGERGKQSPILCTNCLNNFFIHCRQTQSDTLANASHQMHHLLTFVTIFMG